MNWLILIPQLLTKTITNVEYEQLFKPNFSVPMRLPKAKANIRTNLKPPVNSLQKIWEEGEKEGLGS